MEVSDKDLRPGALVASRFVLERRLGAGGMGVVWSAVSQADQSRVALKFLRGDRPHSERVRQRFLQEAEATRKIHHPGVVLIHDVVEDAEGLPVLVMDLLEGETLAARLERGGALKGEEAIRLLLPAVSAIAAAHDVRIIHRDLKPENLFLCKLDGREEIRVLDFGIAKVMRDGEARSGLMTSTGVVMGTPFYMAPEQLFSEGEIDERADVWAFGVILYECVAGKRPFSGPSVGQVLRLIALDEYTPLAQAAPGTPAAIGDLVSRLLARERSRRPRTMREVEQLLRSILEGTYEITLQYAETVEISPAAQTLADGALTPSSGQIRGLERSIAPGVTTGANADTTRTAKSRRGVVIAAVAIAALGALGVMRARAIGSEHAGAALPPVPTPEAPPSVPAVPPKLAEVAPEPSAVVPAHTGAPPARRTHSEGHPEIKPEVHDASAPAPERRPGSVVDTPPF